MNALLLCLFLTRNSPAAVIACSIVRGAVGIGYAARRRIAIIIRPDHPTGTVNGAGLFIVANHPPLPIDRPGIVAVIIVVAIGCDWCGVTIRSGSRIGLRRRACD